MRWIKAALVLMLLVVPASAQFGNNATRLRGKNLCNPLAPTDGQALVWNTTGQCWGVATNGGAVGKAAAASTTTAPGWLSWPGDGSLGASNCSGSLGIGEYYYSSFTVSLGNTCTVNGSNVGGAIIRVTGACSILGTLTIAGYVSSATGGDWGATGGGGGFGAVNGTAAPATLFNSSTVSVGGTAGTSGVSGGGGNAVAVNRQSLFIGEGTAFPRGGGPGGAGGSSGGAAGAGGGTIVLVCGSFDYTGGTITAAGSNGGAGGANTGGGGGGGGGVLILAAKTITVGGGSLVVTGGSGGAIGTGTSTAGGGGQNGWTKSIVIP